MSKNKVDGAGESGWGKKKKELRKDGIKLTVFALPSPRQSSMQTLDVGNVATK